MNILMLTTHFLPIRGGVGTYVLEISRNLPRDVEIHIVAPEGKDKSSDYSAMLDHPLPDNISVHLVPCSYLTWPTGLDFRLKLAMNIRHWIREYDIDVVHSQSEMPDYLVPISRVGIPFVTTVHSTVEEHYSTLNRYRDSRDDLVPSEYLVRELGPALTTLEDIYYTNKRSYISVSDWGMNELIRGKAIDPARIRVVHNGVDSHMFHPNQSTNRGPTQTLGDEAEKVRVLFLSRLAQRKGIHQLLGAIPKVQERVPSHFSIVGPGTVPQTRDLKKDCVILGPIPYSKVPEIYREADIFVLPSLSENLPITVLEAMASGVAVIASNICGIPEIIDDGDNGILVEPGDVDGLVDAIVCLAKDRALRESIAKQGRKTILEKFSWKEAAVKTRDFYEHLHAEFRSS